MIRSRYIVVVLLSLATFFPVQAQFPTFLPSSCANNAKKGINGANDTYVVAIVNIGLEVDLGIAKPYIGMNMTDGTAMAWMYVVHSPGLDTSVAVPQIKLLGSCAEPPFDLSAIIGGAIPVDELGTTVLPDNAIEGLALVTAVKGNADYQAWATIHPDSLPSISALSILQQDLFGFPAGTPFWILNWGPVGDTSAAVPFQCLVHAVTAQTECFGGDPTSVQEVIKHSRIIAQPNPTSEFSSITLPASFVGTRVNMTASSVTGESVELNSGVLVNSQQQMISVSQLTSGLWNIRIAEQTTGRTATTQIIIQR